VKIAHLLCLALVAAAVGPLTGCDKKGPEPQGNGAPAPAHLQGIAVTVDGAGYHPAEIKAPAGQPAHLVFTRTSDEGCGQQLVFPTLNIRKDLPLNQPVPVDITMPASGSVAFTCGMAMWKGSVVAE
jgi:plastocyanin domain-containing protein